MGEMTAFGLLSGMFFVTAALGFFQLGRRMGYKEGIDFAISLMEKEIAKQGSKEVSKHEIES